MKLPTITIRGKLFLVFLMNALFTIIISVLVINSFNELSESIKFNSKSFSFLKSNLDDLRLKQEKLKNTNSLFSTDEVVVWKSKSNLIESNLKVEKLINPLMEKGFNDFHNLIIKDNSSVFDQIKEIEKWIFC